MKKLNIGCGKDLKKGFINLDSIKLPGIDVVHDLNKFPWPFKDSEFDLIYCSHVLEHLDSIIGPVEEIWRISKDKARILIEVPITPSIWAFVDPTHKQFFTYMTFNYFRPEDNLNYYSKARFNIKKRKIIFSNYMWPLTKIINSHEKLQKIYYVFFSFIVPANFLRFELEVVKKEKKRK